MHSPNQLAPGSCFNCRRQKQRCDRLLPQCSRCSSKAVACDYKATASSQISAFSPGTQVEAAVLVHLRDSCSFDLSPLAERYLIWAACASDDSAGDEGNHAQPTLSTLIQGIFSAGGVDLPAMIETYFTIAHSWLPILDKEQLYLDISHLLGYPGYQNDVTALLLICIHIFLQQPCQHPNHSVRSALYRTARRLFFLLQTSARSPSIALLQSGLLLAAYELGHGMSKDAYGTLGVCTSLAQQLSLEPGGCDRGMIQRSEITQLDLCWSGIVLLDRYVPPLSSESKAKEYSNDACRTIMLSDFDYRIPQSVGLNHQFVGAAVGKASDEDLHGDDLPRKFVARAKVALHIGKILDAMASPDPVQREEAETSLHRLGKSFPLCEAVAMSLSALAILYCLRDTQISTLSSPATRSAVQSVYNIVFDTFHTEGEIGAAIRMDRLCVDGLASEDLKELRSTLESFSTRWKLGESFIEALNAGRKELPLDRFQSIGRVAQLEKKIDGIVSLLAAQKGLSPLTPESPQDVPAQQQPIPEDIQTVQLAPDRLPPPIIGRSDDDYADLELFPGFRITHDEATKRLEVYRRDYVPEFPFVPMPNSLASHEFYSESRFLFWTILAVVSPLKEKVQMDFKAWFRKYLAEHVVMGQERSLDILQGILVYLAWNDFHFYGDLQVTSIIQLAIGLIIDLRLDRPAGAILGAPRSLLGDAWTSMGKPCSKIKTDQSSQDKRAVLGMYYITAILSSFFKKNTIVPWSNHLSQCCDHLIEAREYESDLYLVALVRMQHLAERGFSAIPAVDYLDPTPPTFRGHVAMTMNNVHRELERLSKFQPDSVKQNHAFWAHYYTLLVRLYEPTILMRAAPLNTSDGTLMEPLQHSEYMWKCLEAVADSFQEQLAIPAAQMSTLPVTVNCVLAFATVTASRLILSENSPDWDTSLARRRLNFQDTLKGLSDQFEAADQEALRLDRRRRVMEDGSSVFLKCSFKVRWIRQWYTTKIPQEEQQQHQQQQHVETPCAALAQTQSVIEPTPDWAANFQFDDDFWADLMTGYDADALDTSLASVAPAH
ncbi:Zn(2)-C6 fungal-type domain-containing protein [Fusarium sp. Ph1]|nr:Zn(2)-C6 fungal-type domain-containing protein [Fusarium sp. Ph1]